MEEKEESEEPPKEDSKKTLKDLGKNKWIISTIVLGVLLLITLFTGSITGNVIGKGNIGGSAIEFFNNQLSQTPGTLESVKEVSGVYQVNILSDGELFPLYFTKDGNFIAQGNDLIPLTGSTTPPSQNQQAQQPQTYSEEDLEKLREFSQCLASKGVKIYGANWCGWTKKWAVETLGGFDIASAVYVECTENTELCAEEEVSGYPTTKINGEVYTGARTIEAIAEVTGCAAPELEGTGTSTSDSGDAAQC